MLAEVQRRVRRVARVADLTHPDRPLVRQTTVARPDTTADTTTPDTVAPDGTPGSSPGAERDTTPDTTPRHECRDRRGHEPDTDTGAVAGHESDDPDDTTGAHCHRWPDTTRRHHPRGDRRTVRDTTWPGRGGTRPFYVAMSSCVTRLRRLDATGPGCPDGLVLVARTAGADRGSAHGPRSGSAGPTPALHNPRSGPYQIEGFWPMGPGPSRVKD